MSKDKLLEFICKYRNKKWYQPLVLKEGVLELDGLWDKDTKQLADKLLQGVAGKSILDVGCNTGFFLQQAFQRRAARLVGIDNDPEVIQLAVEITDLLNQTIEFQCIDASQYCPTEHFDLVLILNLLDFVDDPQDCLNKYLNICDTLIVEHENHHKSLFPKLPDVEDISRRASGRILSIFHQNDSPINSIGCVVNSAMQETSPATPIYPIIFKEYSRLSPLSKALDISSPITADRSLSGWTFRKDIEGIQTIHELDISSNALKMTIKLTESYPSGYEFGIAIPLPDQPIKDIENNVTNAPVARYIKTFEDLYRDQKLLTIPAIVCGPWVIFCSTEYNVKFFNYKDKRNYIRITSSSSLTNRLTIFVFQHGGHPANVYLRQFPGADFLINHWKKDVVEAEKKYGIQILCQTETGNSEFSFGKITGQIPKNSKVTDALKILRNELQKYPARSFKQIGLNTIFFSQNITLIKEEHCESLLGSALPEQKTTKGWIILDISSDFYNVLHHEIFHLLTPHLDLDFDLFKDLPFDLSNTFEAAADLFSLIMMNQYKQGLRSFAEIIKKSILDLFDDFQFNDTVTRSSQSIKAHYNDKTEPMPFGNLPDITDIIKFTL